jgi:hypothetical protein
MIRRTKRLTKEYLYIKSLEGKERLLYEKKRKIREALQGFHHSVSFKLFNFIFIFLYFCLILFFNFCRRKAYTY